MKRKTKSGWSTVKMTLIIIVLFLFALFYTKKIFSCGEPPRTTRTRAHLEILDGAVKMFKLDTGRYPTQQAGLVELIKEPSDVTGWDPGGYLESSSLPKDGWGNEFIYKLNPKSGKPFVIISYGPDGKPGGEGYDYDLYSTDRN